MRLGTTEIILIVVLALVLFGGGKLAGVGKALGKSMMRMRTKSPPRAPKQRSNRAAVIV